MVCFAMAFQHYFLAFFFFSFFHFLVQVLFLLLKATKFNSQDKDNYFENPTKREGYTAHRSLVLTVGFSGNCLWGKQSDSSSMNLTRSTYFIISLVNQPFLINIIYLKSNPISQKN